MERQVCRRQAGHQTEEDGTDNRTADVNAHNAAAFRAVQAEPFADESYVRFAGYGVGSADSFPLQPYKYCQGNTDDDSAQVTEFLQDQCRGSRQDLRQAGTYQGTVPGHQQHQGNA